MNKQVRKDVVARAMWQCEAGCGTHVTEETGHADHFFGRAKAAESVETVWFLCLRCDDAKTNNRPSALHWQTRYLIHAAQLGYWTQVERALSRIFILHARGLTT